MCDIPVSVPVRIRVDPAADPNRLESQQAETSVSGIHWGAGHAAESRASMFFSCAYAGCTIRLKIIKECTNQGRIQVLQIEG